MPVIAAGGTFAMTTLAGLLVGIWIAGRTGQGLWALAGLFGGLAFGGYAAYRLLMRSL
ncbi:MAG TPA: hypothetical protein VGG89_11670 [Candidatus Baltobacteraceae bacterium]|jgi:hypothetical protein